ncbi:MAG: 30S ribosomal protein S13 [Candidatus Helarchaeota archaeon]
MSFRHIIRMVSTDLNGNLKVPHALTKIKGINIRYAEILTKIAGIDPNQRLGYLPDRDIKKLEEILKEKPETYEIPSYLVNRQKDIKTGEDAHVIGSDLMLVTKSDIDRMKRTKSLKGIRHQLGLKVRGQRTKSTGRKGQIVGVHRKKLKQQKKKK